MSERKRGKAATAGTAPAAGAASDNGALATAVERRLAGMHLRLGSFALARAELEHLAAEDRLDVAGLADLAEVRWRMGDLELAARAATAHLDAAGVEPIARVIAAEAAASAGRPAEARAHSGALSGLTANDLEARFAGMPRLALWPAASGGATEALEAFGPSGDAAAPGGGSVPGGLRPDRASIAADRPGRGGTSDDGQSDDQGPGLWPGEGPAAGAEPAPVSGRALAPETDAATVMARGRADVRSGTLDRLPAGLDRLALALRLDPTLAPGVLEALGRRREPAALVVRGDACRILGRTLEAEAAYLAAAAALDRPGAAGEG